MSATTAEQGSWSKVEKVTSLCLQITLLCFIGCRLAFADWWPLPALDFAISSIAVVLLVASFWFPSPRRSWRISVVLYASATQLVPMVLRDPLLLVPLLGGLIPVAILIGSLVALSRKKPTVRPPQSS
jgi:hypothetical protein